MGSFSNLDTLSEPIDEEPEEKNMAQNDEWIKKLPVDMRTLLMQMMNTEVLVTRGDTNKDPKELYPLNFFNLREIVEKPSLLNGKRTQVSKPDK